MDRFAVSRTPCGVSCVATRGTSAGMTPFREDAISKLRLQPPEAAEWKTD